MKKALTVLIAAIYAFSAFAQGGPQLYNLNLDSWHKDKKTWYPYAAGKSYPIEPQLRLPNNRCPSFSIP